MLLRCCLCALFTALALHAQTGHAEDCAASGTVVNAITGEPIPKATVTFRVALPGAPHSGASTDVAGKWAITNTTCGVASPTVTHAGFIDGHYQPSPGSGSSRRTIELVSGSPLHDLKIALMPEAAISGRVQDPDGDPIGGATVQVMRVTTWNGKRQLAGYGVPGGISDPQGNFRLAGFPPGRYLICANSREVTYPVGGGGGRIYKEDCYPGPLSSGVSSAMPVEGGREVRTTLTLTPVAGVRVRGKVSSAAANVRLLHPNGDVTSYAVPSDRDGSFEIYGVPPGLWIIEATGPRPLTGGIEPSVRAPLQVGDTDANGLTLVLQPPGSLSGAVRYELSHLVKAQAGAANSAVNLNLEPDDRYSRSGPVQWDASRLTFVFTEVQPALYRLHAYSSAPGTYVKSATLRGQDVLNQPLRVDGPTGVLEIVVSDDTGNLDATVTDADDHPASGAVVLIPRAGAPIIIDAGDDGKASRKNIPSGEYKAWAFDDIAKVPYAEEEWMAQNAGPSQKVTVTTAGTANVTLKRAAAPSE